MLVFPYSSPIVLTDDLFVQYGGQTGTTTPAQRNAAYLISETQASQHFGTFLLPITVTGVFDYRPGQSMISTDYGMVHRIIRADVVDKDNNILYLITGSGYRYMYVNKDGYGYLQASDYFYYACGYPFPYSYPYVDAPTAPVKFRVTYEAGLPTGTANHPSIMLALTMAAQINLNEMKFPSENEGVGDIGIQSFSSLDYSERRKDLKNTTFGNSARANKIVQLLDSSGVRRYQKALML